MNITADFGNADFWQPEFDVETRDDGTILMRQPGELTGYLPTLADYLDKWANLTPQQPWIARRGEDGQWIKIAYGEARDQARRIGGALLEMGLGPDRPLLILSENSLEHALLGAACFYVGIPYAPVSPAYSLVSKDHGKLRDIAATLQPGAIFADRGAPFGAAINAISSDGCHVVTAREHYAGAVAFDDLLNGEPQQADAARGEVSADTVVKYLFTSGSTGSPKAVINTNGMICAMQAMVRDC
ncbi:AMP-binding protein, partial [Marivita sp. XM-24bin2]